MKIENTIEEDVQFDGTLLHYCDASRQDVWELSIAWAAHADDMSVHEKAMHQRLFRTRVDWWMGGCRDANRSRSLWLPISQPPNKLYAMRDGLCRLGSALEERQQTAGTADVLNRVVVFSDVDVRVGPDDFNNLAKGPALLAGTQDMVGTFSYVGSEVLSVLRDPPRFSGWGYEDLWLYLQLFVLPETDVPKSDDVAYLRYVDSLDSLALAHTSHLRSRGDHDCLRRALQANEDLFFSSFACHGTSPRPISYRDPTTASLLTHSKKGQVV